VLFPVPDQLDRRQADLQYLPDTLHPRRHRERSGQQARPAHLTPQHGWYCGASGGSRREIIDHSAFFDSNDYPDPAGISGSRSELPLAFATRLFTTPFRYKRTLINAHWPADIVGKLGH
jgi:hypothetical protein